MVNGLYVFTVQNLVFGGVGVLLLFWLLMSRASKVAATNDRAKMFNWMVMPAVLVIGAGALALVAWNVTGSRLQTALTSEPVVNAVALGDGLTQSIDNILAQGGIDSSLLGGFSSAGSFPSSFSAPSGPVVFPTQEPSTGNPPVLPTVAPVMEAAASDGNNGGQASYVVQPGDSMYKIAERYFGDGSRYADLCAANGMAIWQCSQLRRGQVIKLTFDGTSPPRERVPTAAPTASGQQIFAAQQRRVNPVVTNKGNAAPDLKPAASYTIQNGDTIYEIAQKSGNLSKVYDICRLNRQTLGDNCDNLTAGATIALP